MSYIRLTVYSFVCDAPADPHGPGGESEILPMFGKGLRAAHGELRAEGWVIRDGKHYCPKHKGHARREANR